MIEFFNGYKNVLMFYKGDYGLPVVYTASDFQIDDEIVFCVSGNVIAPKIFTVDALSPDGTFEFNLSLTASEAQAIATARGAVLWNFKQYRNNHFLETLKTGIFEVKDAVKSLKGAKGDKGDTGEQGEQGVKGDKGDTGATGAAGADWVPTSQEKAEIAAAAAVLIDVSGKENSSNKVTSISSSPTDTQYPSAAAVKTFVEGKGYLTQHQSLASYYTKSETDSLLAQKLDKTADISAVVLAAARTLQPLPVSSTSDMTDTNRLYVYNGTLWQYREVTGPSYTNLVDANAWNTGYRMNSSGKLAALSGSSVSNFIPAKPGDILRVKGWNFTLTPQFYSYVDGYSAADEITFLGGVAVSTNAVGSGNSSFAYERIETLADGTRQYTIALNNSGTNKMSASCNYIRISGTSPADLGDVIITINEEISGGSTRMEWIDTGIAYSGSTLSNDVLALADRVDDAEDDISGLDSRVASLESGAQSVTFPSYWENAVSAVEATVRGLQDAAGYNAVNFVFFSDMHIDGDGTNYAHNIGVLARRVMNDLSIPVCVNAGDINNRNSEASKEAVMEDVAEAKRILAPIGSDRLLTCRGNHDLYYGNPAYTKGFSANELYNLIYRDQAMDVKRVFGEGGTYYYADCIAQKMRYIVLDCHTSEYSVSADGSMSFDAYNKNGYGNAQLNWLAHTALDLPEGWTAAVIQHCPPTYGYAKSASTGYGIRDLGVFVGIVNAYCNRTSYTGSYAHDDNNGEGDWADVSVSCNFVSASGWLCGIFCGHRHTDNIYTSPTACPIFVITCAKSGSSANENTRTYGTDTETALDIVTVNRATREVTLTRLGVRSTDSHDSDGNRSYSLNS